MYIGINFVYQHKLYIHQHRTLYQVDREGRLLMRDNTQTPYKQGAFDLH